VIVAGDTNMNDTDEAQVQALIDGAELRDTCRELACGQEARIDRVFVRDSEVLTWQVDSWALAEEFVTDRGEQLSDHQAVTVGLSWATSG
jgi:endonuclease/exonuclease/phosphatase family metal-dependent hydrolase